MNTNTLANKLMVSPKTIRRWIQSFQLQFEKNEHGHYRFTEEDFIILKTIKENLDAGTPLKDINKLITPERMEFDEMMEYKKTTEFEQLFTKVFENLKMHEKKINEKADEVVSYQVLQHRREMEELQLKISNLEKRISEFEIKQTTEVTTEKPIIEERKKRKGLIRAVLG